ncbi:MAG TPA: hypothetical protein VEB86_01335 [Chryseosolibacter sp.]|nr:hypothetical protein [Chryseosolibacter sp.]
MNKFLKTAIAITILALFSFEADSQDSEKQFIFNKDVKLPGADTWQNVKRFTPTIAEAKAADSLAQSFIVKNSKNYMWADRIKDYYGYYRQYVGYVSTNNEKVVFVNCFCKPHKNWKKKIINDSGGIACYFSLNVNLDTNRVYNFYINAPH